MIIPNNTLTIANTAEYPSIQASIDVPNTQLLKLDIIQNTFNIPAGGKYDENGHCILKYVNNSKYEMFKIPKNVGGRYSVLTAVGLLPMAVANINFEDILDGAQFASFVFNNKDVSNNDCYKYALYRNVLKDSGKDIEILSSYEPSFQYFVEWYKQLFGESEGKDGTQGMPVRRFSG